MVNNSTNVNKTNNQLSLNTKKGEGAQRHMTLEIQVNLWQFQMFSLNHR